MLKKLAAIGLCASALVLIAPSVATAAPLITAASDTYTGTPRVTVSDPVIDVCEASTVVFAPGYFEPSENVAVSVSGLHGADASISGNTAGADGSLVVSFSPPTDGEGSYWVAFDGSRSYNATVTVSESGNGTSDCEQGPAVAAAGTELPLTGESMELALTGGSVSPWVLGGGALALAAGGALVIAGVTRRKRT